MSRCKYLPSVYTLRCTPRGWIFQSSGTACSRNSIGVTFVEGVTEGFTEKGFDPRPSAAELSQLALGHRPQTARGFQQEGKARQGRDDPTLLYANDHPCSVLTDQPQQVYLTSKDLGSEFPDLVLPLFA